MAQAKKQPGLTEEEHREYIIQSGFNAVMADHLVFMHENHQNDYFAFRSKEQLEKYAFQFEKMANAARIAAENSRSREEV